MTEAPADTKRKWLPPHNRAPGWVAEHRRRDGALVRRHWRRGAQVKGHYATVCQHPTPPAVRRASWPSHRRQRRATNDERRTTIFVRPTPVNAAVALALEAMPHYRVTAQPDADAVSAALGDVIWTDAAGYTHRAGPMSCALETVALPSDPVRIVLEIGLTQPDGYAAGRYRLEAPVFVNPDLSAAVAQGASADPETVIRLLERLQPKGSIRAAAPTGDAVRRRNRLRQQLGRQNPEQSLYHAFRDTLESIRLPDLPVRQSFTLRPPGANYLITITPDTETEPTP